FFKDFFRPGLLAELAAGQRPRPNTKLGQSVPPSLRIVSPEQDAPVEAPRVVLEVEALDQGGGVEGPWLFHNGTRVRAPGRPSRQGQTVHQQFPVALVEGENRLEVRASSADGSWESEPARLWLRFEKPIEKPALFMLSVGVNKYAQNRFNLQYAADDAHAMAELFKHRGPSLYREVYITELLDKEATRKGIALALEDFAQKAQPRDTLIVFLAGHGMMIGERYYFIPSEFHLEGPASLEAAIKENGLAADALADELTAVPALKRLLVIDTCQSGGAVAMALRQRGAFGLRGAIERLGRAQGLFAIAAAAPSQEAHEVAELGHGILSYTLLAGLHDVRAGPLRDKAIPSGPDRVADVLTWFNFASDQVPQLTRRYFGSEQDVQTSSQGMSFPLLPLEDGS
ncbi:MAG TPA: caspase family protein, partial [Isosphaeraceae bacterium]|nr:caspase family protein [Isosphaeraceae bacterium]